MFRKFSVFTTAAVALMSVAGTSAQATTIAAQVLRADLTKIQLDSQLGIKPDRAEVLIHMMTQEVVVRVFPEFDCPSGRVCPAVMPEPKLFRATLRKTEDDCGSMVYLASLDQRPADGKLTEIRVQDNRTRVCRDLRDPTEVQLRTSHYNRIEGREVTTFSRLHGAALVNISSVTPQLPNHGVKYVSELTSFNVDPALIRGKVTDAKLELDYSTRTATLQIGSNPCPVVHGYVACSAIRAERVIEVSIVSRVDVGCGSQKITALHDGRPADGQLEILEIVDHTARVCMDLRPHAVEVTLTTESAGMGGPIVRTRSTFGGELFQR